MSTAIALQDMQQESKGSHAVRRRSVSRRDTRLSASTQGDDDEWASHPQDNPFAVLPLDSRSFIPTRVYWISPHGMLTRDIKVLDLTKDMEIPYSGFTDAYKEEIKKTLKDHSFTPAFTVHRRNWIGLTYNITDDQGRTIADWSHPWVSTREARLTFPNDSTYSSHPITLNNRRWGRRTESFTINSTPFIWEMDSLWHSNFMTLYKVLGFGDNQKKIEVGKYTQKWYGGFVTGGGFVVNEDEIDGHVACMTLVVVLKKKRQRAAERRTAD